MNSRLCAGMFSVANEATSTLTAVRAVCVGTLSLWVTVMQAQSALVHVGALGVRPARLIRVQAHVVFCVHHAAA